jgi:hypothetical protein
MVWSSQTTTATIGRPHPRLPQFPPVQNEVHQKQTKCLAFWHRSQVTHSLLKYITV